MTILLSILMSAAMAAPQQPPPGLWDRDSLLGDEGGIRPALAAHGITFTLELTGEVISNVSGGVTHDTGADLLLDWVIEADLNKAVGWTGGAAKINPMWIAGDGLNGDVGDLTLVSNINARGGVRVYEAWLEQSVFDRAVSLRAGILAADQEFILTTAGVLYYNSVFGGPVFLSANMRWPIYPVGALGARLKVAVAEKAYVQAAVYDGDPGSEENNRYGLEVAVHGHEGIFMIGEAGWTFGDPLPVTLKAGLFHHTGEFVDHSPGVPQRGLSGGYVLAEHTVCRDLTGIGGCPEGTVDVFVRAGVAQEDVARVSFGLDSGINLTGILPGRPADVLGVGLIYARIGTDYAAAQPDAPAWGYEMVVEATYKITFSKWLSLQPDLQYIRHPGGSTATRDAWVIGMRIDVFF